MSIFGLERREGRRWARVWQGRRRNQNLVSDLKVGTFESFSLLEKYGHKRNNQITVKREREFEEEEGEVDDDNASPRDWAGRVFQWLLVELVYKS